MRKLTITIDDRVYDGLLTVVGRGHIGKFLEDLARPLVLSTSLFAAYAELSADKTRESEANEWCDSLAADHSDAAW
jgi:hypothetical protein